MWLSARVVLLGVFVGAALIGVPDLQAETSDSAAPAVERVSEGHWLSGISALWNARQNENTSSLAASNIYGERTDWQLQLTGLNVVYGQTGIGAALRYGRNSINERYVNSDGDSVDAEQLKTTLGLYGIFRPYTPLFNSTSLYAFAEVSIGVSLTPTVREETVKAVLTRTYTDQSTFSIGMSPGVAVVLESGLAFEAVITLIGFSASWTDVETNGTFTSSSSAQSFDLQVNLLSVRLGLGYYF